jgi:hypothetical protein
LVERYLVRNGRLGTRDYRERQYRDLAKESDAELLSAVREAIEVAPGRRHKPLAMPSLNEWDRRMRVIDEYMREAADYQTELENVKLLLRLGSAEAIGTEPWDIFRALEATEPAQRRSQYHMLMTKNKLDFRSYACLRPEVVVADAAFRLAVEATDTGKGGKWVRLSRDFVRDSVDGEESNRFRDLGSHLADRLRANTDPLQKAEALARVLRQLTHRLDVELGEIPKGDVIEVRSLFLLALNPPELLLNFVYLYEFLFARLDLFVTSSQREHELRTLQNQLEDFFDRALISPMFGIPFSIDLFRLIRTQCPLWTVALVNAEDRSSWVEGVLGSWAQLSKIEEVPCDGVVVKFKATDNPFVCRRVLLRILHVGKLPPPNPKSVNEVFLVVMGDFKEPLARVKAAFPTVKCSCLTNVIHHDSPVTHHRIGNLAVDGEAIPTLADCLDDKGRAWKPTPSAK